MTQQERLQERFAILFCEDRQREFTAANHALMELQNQQIQAVIDLDPDFARFDDFLCGTGL
jgi:hypothetical protein